MLFNNAGIIRVHPLLDVTREDWDRIMEVNLKAVWPERPDDVAGLAAFLASAGPDYMTGQAVNVDGGLVMGS